MTEAELLVLVKERYPTLDTAIQDRVARAATHVMAEPHWARLRIKPIEAVKIASMRVYHRKSF